MSFRYFRALDMAPTYPFPTCSIVFFFTFGFYVSSYAEVFLEPGMKFYRTPLIVLPWSYFLIVSAIAGILLKSQAFNFFQ